MKKFFLFIVVISMLGLAGCGESSNNKKSVIQSSLDSHIVFDPTNGVIPLPNNLLFNGTTDGTLAIPGEKADGTSNYKDPKMALGALDGWSTTAPISITMAPASSDTKRTLDSDSVAQDGAVHLFEATMGGTLSSDPDCKKALDLSACKIGTELKYGTDFISIASGNNVAIVPLKPLKVNQTYLYATTDMIKDSSGRAVAPSSTYSLLKLDIKKYPLDTSEQRLLQGDVNSYESKMNDKGVDPATVTYSALFTTQAIGGVYQTVQKLMLKKQAGFTTSITSPASLRYTVAAALASAGLPVYSSANQADVYGAELTVPSYNACNKDKCPTINGKWHALGDSPVSVLQALQAKTLSEKNYAAQAEKYGIDPAAARTNPTLLVGHKWLLDDGTAADKTKQLTKYNPVPAPTGSVKIPVLITLPNAAYTTSSGKTKPATGWPVVIVMHGLGSTKEEDLAYAGGYASQGIATIAIDMPLHGARSFGLKDGSYTVSATDKAFGDKFKNGNVLNFVNIGSTLSVRGNFKQATLDQLALRLALTELTKDESAGAITFDMNRVSAQGLSLGAIVGTDFSTYANGKLTASDGTTDLGSGYKLKTLSLVAPSGGLAGSFVGSATFGPVLKKNILGSDSFNALVKKANTAGYEKGSDKYNKLVEQVYKGFLPGFSFAVQTAVDSIDPINHAATLAATKLPTQLIEIVGDGENNKSDQVLPNKVDGYPTAGTEALITNLELKCVDSSASGSGVVRFSKGHHSSIANPKEVDGVTDGHAADATTEMQTQVVIFVASQGTQQNVTNSAVVKPCS